MSLLKKNEANSKTTPASTLEKPRGKLSEGGFEEGLARLTGEYVWLWCVNYVYAGTILDVSSTDVLLDNPTIVLESGDFKDETFKEFENVPFNVHVRTSAIESYSKCWKRPTNK